MDKFDKLVDWITDDTIRYCVAQWILCSSVTVACILTLIIK